MKRMYGWAAGAALLLAGCHESPKSEAAATLEVQAAVATAQSERVPDIVELSGELQARERAEVAAQVNGRVTMVSVREGDHVRRGQVLARLDAAEAQAVSARALALLRQSREERAAAESESQLAASSAQRYEKLYQRRSVSPQEYDQARARVLSTEARRKAAEACAQAAESSLAQARSIAGYAVLRAPFDGVVARRAVDVGSMAVVGAPLFAIEQKGPLEVEVMLDQSMINYVRIGREEEVCIDAPQQCVSGKIVEVNPTADAQSRSFVVKIALPASTQLHSGMTARARIRKGEREAWMLPISAVVTRGAMKAIYVVNADGRAALRYVTLGAEGDGRVEVLSGLAVGEKYLPQPPANLTDGARIVSTGAAR